MPMVDRIDSPGATTLTLSPLEENSVNKSLTVLAPTPITPGAVFGNPQFSTIWVFPVETTTMAPFSIA